jgi:hypothetical protein
MIKLTHLLVLGCLLVATSTTAQTLVGPVKIDSTLTVKDSVIIEKGVTIEQDVKVKGEGIFTQQLKAKSDLKVLGVTKMKGDGFVEGTFKFKGLADQLATTDRLLSINANGKVKVASRDALLSKSNFNDCFQFSDGVNTAFPAPTWASTTGYTAGVLYTGTSCPANVGIGTSSPIARLDVRGTGHFQSIIGLGALPHNDVQVSVASDKTVGLCVVQSSNINYDYAIKSVVDNPTTKAFAVVNSTSNDDVFRVLGDGKVWATEINVYHEGDFPDYVFASDYNLRPLAMLENYIDEQGHLPNIPTAADVAENGINVGELQVAQMEKIEELTLYLIDLSKQVEALKTEVESLKTQH